MKNELVIVIDFGGQYNQLIARRVREHNVFCEVKPYKTSIEEIKAMTPEQFVLGIIRERYGSADAYLEAEYGLTPARLMRLRRMYLE